MHCKEVEVAVVRDIRLHVGGAAAPTDDAVVVLPDGALTRLRPLMWICQVWIGRSELLSVGDGMGGSE